jgi:hypothetical protein
MSAAAEEQKEARVAASGVCNSGKEDSDKDSADDGNKNATNTMTTFDVR